MITNPTTKEIPQFLRDLIASPPRHGEGVHSWLFKVARQLHAHRDEQTICDLLTAAVDGCGRHVPESEIRAAVESSRNCAWQPSGGGVVRTQPRPKWPPCDDKRIAKILSNPIGTADLWDWSLVRIEGETPDTDWLIDWLFPGNPLLCVGYSSQVFSTRPREDFRGTLGGQSLIVPSPMTAQVGIRKSDGKLSEHTLDNTGPRTYLVTEFDQGTPDEQAALLWHLGDFAPLVMVLSSGGKSLHGWFNCNGTTEETQLRFFKYAVSLGADPATWLRSQFVRMPMGWRHDKNRRQTVLFFDYHKAVDAAQLP